MRNIEVTRCQCVGCHGNQWVGCVGVLQHQLMCHPALLPFRGGGDYVLCEEWSHSQISSDVTQTWATIFVCFHWRKAAEEPSVVKCDATQGLPYILEHRLNKRIHIWDASAAIRSFGVCVF